MKALAEDCTGLETGSIGSETSAAVVSVYNSWSYEGEDGQFDDGTSCSLLGADDSFAALPDTEDVLRGQEIFEELKRRCPPEDLPRIPQLRRRRRPTCQFLNCFGSRLPPPPVVPPQTPSAPILQFAQDLGLEEKDALFPLCASKARHDGDDDCDGEDAEPDAKRQKVEVSTVGDRCATEDGDSSRVSQVC